MPGEKGNVCGYMHLVCDVQAHTGLRACQPEMCGGWLRTYGCSGLHLLHISVGPRPASGGCTCRLAGHAGTRANAFARSVVRSWQARHAQATMNLRLMAQPIATPIVQVLHAPHPTVAQAFDIKVTIVSVAAGLQPRVVLLVRLQPWLGWCRLRQTCTHP